MFARRILRAGSECRISKLWQHTGTPCACRSADLSCALGCDSRIAHCPGLFGEITAFHEGELCCRLCGQKWSKGLSTSSMTACSFFLAEVPRQHTSTHGALRSAESDCFSLETESIVRSVDVVEGSSWSQDPSTSPSNASPSLLSKSRQHTGVPCARRSADCQFSDHADTVPCRELFCEGEGSSRSQDSSISPATSAPHVNCCLRHCWDFFCKVAYQLPIACIPGLQRSSSPLLGVRIGEASHPGPRGPSGKGGNGGLNLAST